MEHDLKFKFSGQEKRGCIPTIAGRDFLFLPPGYMKAGRFMKMIEKNLKNDYAN